MDTINSSTIKNEKILFINLIMIKFLNKFIIFLVLLLHLLIITTIIGFLYIRHICYNDKLKLLICNN
jgi:hypothetical protein